MGNLVKVRDLKDEQGCVHPRFGHCQCMGLVTHEHSGLPRHPLRWVFWSHVDEEGDYSEFLEHDGNLEVELL